MKAVDTNVLIFAKISGSRHHGKAKALLKGLGEGSRPWAIPWPCIYEFLRVVTHPKVFHPPVPLGRALSDLEKIFGSPSLRLLHETPRHAEVMKEVLHRGRSTGNLIHDAHIAALCIEHGVSEFLTGDRDFERFEGLHVVDPY